MSYVQIVINEVNVILIHAPSPKKVAEKVNSQTLPQTFNVSYWVSHVIVV